MNRTMNRWDHFDVIVAVGICATIVGASLFFFAFGGAPSGLLDQRFERAVPAAIDPGGMAQEALGQAIVESGTVSYVEGEPHGLAQTRLGGAIVAAARAEQARTGLMPAFRDEARASLDRMHGMIQANAGRAVVQAAQRMQREGGTSAAQIMFQETLGRIVADMSERERMALSQRQETLGRIIVGRLLALDGYSGHIQEQLGAAVRDTGIVTARIEAEKPFAQESLGAAVLMAAMSAASSVSASPVLVASAEGGPGARGTGEVLYQAGVILVAALFMMVWGLRSVAGTGPGLVAQKPVASLEGQYRKVG